MSVRRSTGLVQRSAGSRFDDPRPVEASHLLALMDMRGTDFTTHHHKVTDRDGKPLEIWWLANDQTGAVDLIFEDTRGLN